MNTGNLAPSANTLQYFLHNGTVGLHDPDSVVPDFDGPDSDMEVGTS